MVTKQHLNTSREVNKIIFPWEKNVKAGITARTKFPETQAGNIQHTPEETCCKYCNTPNNKLNQQLIYSATNEITPIRK